MPMIGARVRALRLARHMTQEQLAQAAGTTGAYVGHIEAGRRQPAMPLSIRLARVFGISLDALVSTESQEEAANAA